MATGDYSEEPFSEETIHKQLIWEEFLQRAVDAGNNAMDWLDMVDVESEKLSDDEFEAVYHSRWESTGDIITAAYNFLWPEIEALAMKLGVPFQPEIMELHSDD